MALKVLNLSIRRRGFQGLVEFSRDLAQLVEAGRIRQWESIRAVAVHRNQDLSYRQLVEGTARLIGDHLAVAATNLRKDPRIGQLEKSGANQADGDFQFLGDVLGGRRVMRLDKRLDAMMGDEQSHRAFETVAKTVAVGGELIAATF